MLSRVEHPAMAADKARPGSVPVTLRQLGHPELLEVDKVQTGH